MVIEDLLKELVEDRGSDLHISNALPPIKRVDGKLVRMDYPALTSEQVEALLFPMMSNDQRRRLEQDWELDFSYGIKGMGRFRVNFYKDKGSYAAAFRTISDKAPTLEDMGMPPIVTTIAEKPRGLVLVTGPTGSGKSTTLAAMIDYINRTRAEHIPTIEDPIEFVHASKMSVIHQRELGQDTRSFANALKSALREDPDIILVGEMRDYETIALALTAAETGHLVFGTLHTSSASQTIDRIIDVFPQGQQQQIRVQLANSLVAVFAQTLIQKRLPDGTAKGRIMAQEIMVVTPAISNLIRESKAAQIYSTIQTSSEAGMQTLEAADAIKLIKRSMSEIQTSKINQQKKAFRDGYDMDILSADLLVNEKSTMELLENLNSSNQKLVWTTPIVSIFGKTKREIATLRQEMNSVTREANISMTDLQYLQEKAMNAAAPIGINETGSGRHLTTKNLAVLIPFKTKELCQGGQALYYGKNKLSGNLILADRKNLRTPNGMILGTPGSGKSLEAKLEVLETFLKTNDDIIICDPEGEYHPLVYALGGEVIKLSTSSTDYLNPMDIQVSSRDDREDLKLKSDFIITLCDHIAGGKYGLANDEKGIIDRCIERIYEKFFEDPVPEKMPILEDLYNALINYEPEIAVTEELAIDAKKKAVRIANSLVLYVHGSQNYFNHRSTVDSTNRILCFDIRDLSNQLKELGMLIVQDAVWNRVSANRDRNISTRYYCDEFHLLLREKQTAVYAVEIWKRFRKWGGIPTGLTQNVSDFLRSSEIEGILGNSDFIILLHQSSKDQDILLDKFNLTEQQLDYVTKAESGCGLIIYDNIVIPFENRYPTDTKTFELMNTKPKEEVEDGG